MKSVMEDGTHLGKVYDDSPKMRDEWIADVLGVASGRALHLARALRTTPIGPDQFATEVDALCEMVCEARDQARQRANAAQ